MNMYEEAKDEILNNPLSTDLQQLNKLAQMQVEAEKHVESLELELTKAKEHLRKIEEQYLPEAMQSVGMEKFTTEDGFSVSVGTFYDARISEETKFDALNWLKRQGFGSLIKNEVLCKFGRDEADEALKLKNLLSDKDIPFEEKESVHNSTLKAFIKERYESTEENVTLPPTELFNIYIGKRAKIKQPKEK